MPERQLANDLSLQQGHPIFFEMDWHHPTHFLMVGSSDMTSIGHDITFFLDVENRDPAQHKEVPFVPVDPDNYQSPTTMSKYKFQTAPSSLSEVMELALSKMAVDQVERIDQDAVDPIMDPNWYQAFSMRGCHEGALFEVIIVGGERKAVSLTLSDKWPAPSRESLIVFEDLDAVPATIYEAADIGVRLISQYLGRYKAGERAELGVRA